MFFKRTLEPHLRRAAQQFPVVAVMGPRQSGKTTLVRQTFANHAYVSLEDVDRRVFAQQDPRGFLATYDEQHGVIIDEIQEVPELFSYIQGIVDRAYRPGFFILTGSQHFLIYEKITQTLAGRIALLTLLPMSVAEIKEAGYLPEQVESLLLKGGYPRLYAQDISVDLWYANYMSTYVERDARQVLNITDVIAFQRFIKLCAARIGNIINYAELARDCDISPNTAKSWLSILEASFIIKIVPPYYRNFNKRLIKSPKLFFYDTALACLLLGIKTKEDIAFHPLKGALFESFVFSELIKYHHNHLLMPNIYFWRDQRGQEIDFIIEKSFEQIVPLEVKARKTITPDFFKELLDWYEFTEQKDSNPTLIYSGNELMKTSSGTIIPWYAVEQFLNDLYRR